VATTVGNLISWGITVGKLINEGVTVGQLPSWSPAVPLAGSISATSNIVGTLRKQVAINGSISAIGAVSGTVKVQVRLTGAVSASSTLSVGGDLNINIYLAGNIGATAGITTTGPDISRYTLVGNLIHWDTKVSDLIAGNVTVGILPFWNPCWAAIQGSTVSASAATGTLCRLAAISGEIEATSDAAGYLAKSKRYIEIAGVLARGANILCSFEQVAISGNLPQPKLTAIAKPATLQISGKQTSVPFSIVFKNIVSTAVGMKEGGRVEVEGELKRNTVISGSLKQAVQVVHLSASRVTAKYNREKSLKGVA